MNSHDVTDIKLGNEHFKRVFKCVPFVGLIFDRRGRLLDANREAERISGLKLQDFRGKPFSHFGLLGKKDIDKAFSEFRKNLEGKVTGKTVYTIKDKNGKEHLLELIGVPIKQDGKVIAVLDMGSDITEQRITEDALRESENKFRAISESAEDAILVMDDSGMISYWNKAAKKMFGYRKKDALGQDLHNLIAPKRFREGFRKGMRGFVKTGKGAAIGKTLELTGVKRDGTKFPVELSLSSVKIHGAWNAVGIIRDISERKQENERLKRLVRTNRKVIESAPLGIYIANREGRIEHVNPEMLRISGESRRQFLSINVFRLPAYRKAGIAEKIKECIEKGADFSAGPIEYTSQYGGKATTRIFRGIPIEEDSERKALVFVDDITEQERLKAEISKERDTMKKYLEVAGVMFVVLDRKGNIQMINRRGCEILGCDSGDLTGKNWFETCIPERMKNEVKSVFMRSLAGAVEVAEHFENPVKTKNGEERLIEWHNTVLTENGKITGILSSGEDITEKKRAEEALKKKTSELERFNRLAVGRELRMIELKRRIVELEKELAAGGS
ncbi:MAG: PAS domain S-box protein [Candidatus Aenigmarchaeota archaeon]|nr:PAS domain S-box protein [Candidatus Aenigmarchaeota archaeon]